jgi:hypothetical protein
MQYVDFHDEASDSGTSSDAFVQNVAGLPPFLDQSDLSSNACSIEMQSVEMPFQNLPPSISVPASSAFSSPPGGMRTRLGAPSVNAASCAAVDAPAGESESAKWAAMLGEMRDRALRSDAQLASLASQLAALTGHVAALATNLESSSDASGRRWADQVQKNKEAARTQLLVQQLAQIE